MTVPYTAHDETSGMIANASCKLHHAPRVGNSSGGIVDENAGLEALDKSLVGRSVDAFRRTGGDIAQDTAERLLSINSGAATRRRNGMLPGCCYAYVTC